MADPNAPDNEVPEAPSPDSGAPDTPSPQNRPPDTPALPDSEEPPLPESEAEIPDPDLQATQNQVPEENDTESLGTEELRPESDEFEYEAPDTPSTPTRRRTTGEDEQREETIDERIPQEQSDDQIG